MALNPATLNAAFYAVLKTDTAGATVRAALGNAASSVIARLDLNAASLPTAPFLALQAGPITGARYEVQTLFFTWWLYDDAGQRWKRINELIPLLRAAYPKGALVAASVDFPSIGQEVIDAALKLPTRGMQFTVRVRQQ